jgi:hypothetical protein
MTHGGKQEGDLLDVVAHIAGLAHHFGHQNRVARLVPLLQRGERRAELVAQDEDDAASHPPALAGAARMLTLPFRQGWPFINTVNDMA